MRLIQGWECRWDQGLDPLQKRHNKNYYFLGITVSQNLKDNMDQH